MGVLKHDPIDFRICAFCKQTEITYRDGVYRLFHYSTRRYAHPGCLLKAKGIKGLRELPLHLLKKFPALEAERHGVLSMLLELISKEEERERKMLAPRTRSA